MNELLILKNYLIRLLCDNDAIISIAKEFGHYDQIEHVEMDLHLTYSNSSPNF